MRLRKIKLSGFKSFVDPTTLVVPNNLVGIVGPNGCGKSNIIDAVMWVMGESSAKHLRGDSLTDVIFNGSGARNPVGQASVELIFDNTDRKLGGQYASYDEISIKRQINREAISTYFLNGTRCRRRDIQSIFLGTGLGPRSYAIIEQGMISRLIEARPEDLRTFIEEAAGISKYRERRRETENRIRNTKDNITRLNDIREELEKQLNHLQRQARAAERYQSLKKEERQLEAEVQALNWKLLKQQSSKDEDKVRTLQNQVESAITGLREIEKAIVKEREDLAGANDAFNNSQSDYYRIGGDISQLEQKIHHAGERIRDLEAEYQRANAELASCRQQIDLDDRGLQELASTRAGLEPQLKGSRADSDKAYTLLNESEQAMQAWETEWETFTKTVSENNRSLDISRTQLEHLETDLEEAGERRQTLQDELAEIDLDSLQADIERVQGKLEAAKNEFTDSSKQADEKRRNQSSSRSRYHALSEQLNEQRLLLQKQEGRLAALQALQQSAMGEDQESAGRLIKRCGLEKFKRLAQKISVEPEWSHAMEIVLEQFLQDLCVDDVSNYQDAIDSLESGQLGIVSAEKYIDADIQGRFPSLAEKISGDFPLRHLLSTVYTARSYKNALKMRPNLSGTESVITPDGCWVGINWIRINREQDEENSILSREQAMQELGNEVATTHKILKQLEQQANKAREELEQAESGVDKDQMLLNEKQATITDLRANLASLTTQLEQSEQRRIQIEEEIELLDEQVEENRNSVRSLRTEITRISGHQEKLDDQRQELVTQRDKHRNSLTSARERWQSTHEQSHGIALQLESISSRRASLEQSIKRGQIQVSHLETRVEEINRSLDENRSPLPEMKSQLEIMLKEKVSAEKHLTDARNHVQAIETGLRDREQARSEQEHKVQENRDQLEKARLDTQESRVRCQTIEEKLKESNLTIDSILSGMEVDANLEEWRDKLAKVTQKIQRLGPINLAAIDEYNQLSERKIYLDRQDADLREALETLENAISKIDKESRARFRETFDQLNANLQELFPQLFGGGNAYLELTGNDLLETGVTVMAKPPGKRISTIHLLSGGEKALTAVALVFSIFRLNPAPFCILDEVDAPLDDANVGRFSEMVAAMSDEVQFIFITHNKITMEIAQQLLGVTMYEAGVSRLVTVDVDEAVKMAATA